MVKVINYLSDCGYVVRQQNPEDKREHTIKLTAKGTVRTQKIVKKFDELDRLLFENMAEQEKKKFQDLLQHLTNILKSLPANDLFFSYKAKNDKRTKKNKTA